MTITPFQIQRDNQGFPSTGSQMVRRPSQIVQNVELTASTHKTVTVPLDSNSVMVAYFAFTSGADVFWEPDTIGTIALPTGTLTTGTTELLTNGCGRIVTGGSSIQFITAESNVYLSIAYYSVYF